MSTTLTPPPATPTPPTGGAPDGQAAPQPPTPPASGARAIAALTAAAGAGLLLFAAGTGIAGTLASGAVSTSTLTAPTRGVTMLDVDTAAADIRISFADVDEATLSVTGSGADRWELVNRSGTLSLDSDRDFWSGWNPWNAPARATLVLPASLAGVDADLSAGAGAIRVDGSFGAVSLQVDAGSIDASGSATSLDAGVSAGRANLDLAGVAEATVRVSAGRVSGELTGPAPASLTVSAEAGSVDLTLPRARYAVSASQEVGSFTSGLTEDPASGNRVEVRVSAGSVHLGQAR
ncbi:MAG: hypothetical protein PGN24_10395 [Microbacterium arborescens]